MDKIIDLHQDLLSHIRHREMFNNKWQTNFNMLKDANFNVVVATAFPVPADNDFKSRECLDLIEEEILIYNKMCIENGWEIIKTKSQFNQILKSKDRRGLIIHIEGLNYFNNDTFKKLDYWFDLGLRSLGIVWNLDNSLGGGTNGQNGLTEDGKRVIEWCLKKGVIVDLAHMNEKTFNDIVGILDKPLLVSHGNSRSICEDIRNYSDNQISAIAKSNGLIGFFLSNKFINKKESTIDSFINHIDHVINLVGDDYIGIGTDFGGVLSGSPLGLESVSDFSNLIKRLKERGYSGDRINKLLYINSMRVINEFLV